MRNEVLSSLRKIDLLVLIIFYVAIESIAFVQEGK